MQTEGNGISCKHESECGKEESRILQENERIAKERDVGEDWEAYKEKAKMFRELWRWVQNHVYRTNVLNGWTRRGLERNFAEQIALIHSEISECLEWARGNNDKSDHIDAKGTEEELADVIIRIMDLAKHRKLNIPRALFRKMAYNRTRGYKHGGKNF